jgi:hypothetical protein
MGVELSQPVRRIIERTEDRQDDSADGSRKSWHTRSRGDAHGSSRSAPRVRLRTDAAPPTGRVPSRVVARAPRARSSAHDQTRARETPRGAMSTQLRPCVVRCGASGFAVDYWGHNDAIGTSTEHHITRRLPPLAYPRPISFPRVSPPPLNSPETWHPPGSSPTSVRRVLPHPRARGPPRRSEQPMGPARSRDILFRRD